MFWDSESDQLQLCKPLQLLWHRHLTRLGPRFCTCNSNRHVSQTQNQSRHNSHAVSLRHGLHALLGTDGLLGLVMRALLIVSCQRLVKLCVL